MLFNYDPIVVGITGVDDAITIHSYATRSVKLIRTISSRAKWVDIIVANIEDWYAMVITLCYQDKTNWINS